MLGIELIMLIALQNLLTVRYRFFRLIGKAFKVHRITAR